MLAGILIICLFMVVLGLLIASHMEKQQEQVNNLINTLDSILPQTQCGKCGYTGCLPYASAIAHGDADINQCPPGGTPTIKYIAGILGRETKPLNPEFGIEKPVLTAVIDEDVCIGCVKCIKACPVDAIIGAPKQMHSVIEQECTGCELCVEPCPVDCIAMVGRDSNARNNIIELT